MNYIVSVSIVVYETPLIVLEKCLSSIANFHGNIKLNVVENSPKPNLKEYCDTNNIFYYHLPHNPGYGAGHNVVIRKSIMNDIPYHLVVNPDIYFEDDVISVLIKFMDLNPEVGLVMPRVNNLDGSNQYLCKALPSPFHLFFRSILRVLGINHSKFIVNLPDYDYSIAIFAPYLSGCFMFLRVSSLKISGIFDERFFMYPEDIDLTRRIASKYKTICYPYVSVFHEYGGSSYKSPKMYFIHAWNIIKYFNKWGWIFDSQRRILNKKTMAQFKK